MINKLRVYTTAMFIAFDALLVLILINYLVTGDVVMNAVIGNLVGFAVGLIVYFTYTLPKLRELRKDEENAPK